MNEDQKVAAKKIIRLLTEYFDWFVFVGGSDGDVARLMHLDNPHYDQAARQLTEQFLDPDEVAAETVDVWEEEEEEEDEEEEEE
jgi:hypothetical protein|tara:strand:- start:1052 stop:1303 length:252 start_codon:yes stop_codon:yes gene_type:complete